MFAGYNEDDNVTLLLCNNYLREINAGNPDSKVENVTQLVQQVFVGPDFSEGNIVYLYNWQFFQSLRD